MMIVLNVSKKNPSELEVLYNDEYFALNPPGYISGACLFELFNSTKINEVVLLPRIKDVDSDCMLVCSGGIMSAIQLICPELQGQFIELPGKINKNGEIIEEFRESEINVTLREIYKRKPKHVYICLTNSIHNSEQEKSISNVLKGAGYKTTRSVDFFVLKNTDNSTK